MAVKTSPRPSDGPLSASGPSLTIAISTTNGAFVVATVKTTTGKTIRIEQTVVSAGTTKLILRLPPGGVPPGSTLNLSINEHPGSYTSVKFTLK
jgi:hypothetical protein